MVSIPYFTKRAEAKQAKREAEIRHMQNSPTITLGSVTLVNPVYIGPNPYRGPEVMDPRNAGNNFIVIKGKKTPPSPPVSILKPGPCAGRTVRWA